MKKLFLLLSVMFLVIIAGFGQATFKPGIGISFNDFSKTSSGEIKGKVGAQVGASVAFGKKFYIEPGVYYATKSSEYSFTNSQNSSNAGEAVIRGIRVPLAVGLDIIGNEKSLINLRIFGGGSGYFVTGVGKDIEKDNVATPTWGTFAGFGVDVWLLFVDLSYEWSLTNATKSISNIDFGKNRALIFTVGLKF